MIRFQLYEKELLNNKKTFMNGLLINQAACSEHPNLCNQADDIIVLNHKSY